MPAARIVEEITVEDRRPVVENLHQFAGRDLRGGLSAVFTVSAGIAFCTAAVAVRFFRRRDLFKSSAKQANTRSLPLCIGSLAKSAVVEMLPLLRYSMRNISIIRSADRRSAVQRQDGACGDT